jgi:hypothetical protein
MHSCMCAMWVLHGCARWVVSCMHVHDGCRHAWRMIDGRMKGCMKGKHLSMHVCICTYVCTYVCVCMYVCMHVCVCTYGQALLSYIHSWATNSRLFFSRSLEVDMSVSVSVSMYALDRSIRAHSCSLCLQLLLLQKWVHHPWHSCLLLQDNILSQSRRACMYMYVFVSMYVCMHVPVCVDPLL